MRPDASRAAEIPRDCGSPSKGVQSRTRSLNRRRLFAQIASVALAFAALHGCTGMAMRPGIYVADLSDGAPGWIGEPAGVPVWSPRGTALAWASEDGLQIWSAAESRVREISGGPVAARPAWSPDGEVITYIDRENASLISRQVDSGQILFEAPIATDEEIPGRPTILELGGPAWSPDGSRLAFVCWDGAGDELCVIDAMGGGLQQVTRLEPPMNGDDALSQQRARSNVGPPAWAPDGLRLAVAVYPERRGAPAGVFVVDLARGDARRVSQHQPNSEIRWYPDGEAILFSATVEGRSDVMRVPVDRGGSTPLSEELEAGASAPALNADGTRVAVSSGGAIVVMDEDGSTAIVADLGLEGRTPAWRPTGESIAFQALADPIVVYD